MLLACRDPAASTGQGYSPSAVSHLRRRARLRGGPARVPGWKVERLSVHGNATPPPSGSLGFSCRSVSPVQVGGIWAGAGGDGLGHQRVGAGEAAGNITYALS